ncbi:MAG: ABC transporter ATP-binding protein [Candidatus Nanoarchaeia archaeon]|nr:ABC transporter ATP-binding protein [Candidatus Haiyanarchaeum thermophilum]MCW1303039.1 ABC transporter ATP-binding protein [Candidatus Haiyanarchaeum thermophilum]MCW1303717.1 ABC transporter ATP-binding protein [Candidatus Haiyanarchaeum thermophilum]MCW1307093.1 ABC transporter ATP-binding protein [Candidatus Haiyanarchaeum thermophilum]MCW1307764.1 ABC transporter ATP-binding protein [Candidatus Haiyanarchaeum thermophilum]
MMKLVELKNVRKSYRMGKVIVPALRDVSLQVTRGEFLAILGPSGSGKSTLLNIIGCLDRPDEGEVIIDGINVLKLRDEKLAEIRLKQVGFIFQFFNLLPRLTALENVELPLLLAGVDEKRARERAKHLLELVGLESRVNHRPFELSGGEQQRVAIARALVNNPKIVLADEPTGNLDTRSGEEIIQLMKKLNSKLKQTFIVVTHDRKIASIANRIIYLRDGMIVGEKYRR